MSNDLSGQRPSRGSPRPDKTAAIGIDLGTTFSCVAQVDGRGVPRTLPNADGDPTTPSVVLFETNGFVVGKEALKAAIVSPEMIARCVKREMGNPLFSKSFDGESYPPEVIQSLVLEKLKADAELKTGPVQNAVITVPAYFSEPKRRATQDAGRLAGLNVLDIINEPTAAAIAFGVEQGFLDQQAASKNGETVLVYDLGGGTFDVSVVRIEANRFRVIATDGDFQLGGVDFDQKVVSHLSDAFHSKYLIDPSTDAQGEQRLLREAEDAKRSLSTRDVVTIHFEHAGHALSLPLKRRAFNQMTASIIERTRFTTSKVIRDAGLKWTDLTRILLVGGATRMPAVLEMLETESGMRVDRSLAADEAIAHGAAIYANLLSQGNGNGLDVEVTNVNSHNLGVLGLEKATGLSRTKVLVPQNTALPATHGAAFTTAKDNQRSVAVKVVEGGDASGNHSTSIGTCVIRDLPHGLPAGTQVNVIFKYENNGRLKVRASIPSTGQKAKMEIDRVSAVTDSKLDDWSEKIRSRGRPASSETDTPTGEVETSDEQDLDSKFNDIFDLDDFLN
ncbi:Chaperone protein DnaK [Roseimaritima multifibrata]|uniref:Chaperone protein DnaK n=1 Tax=Roseimaritima multifibrata TaxID=1930274 RepID=A0A517M9Z9_9BACT|nr:Hsp70 family protein [Roseimaritima multifibrata]QDS91694.1 Chaperone protein DnaK [Roseimaritima multifibrata]